MKNHFLKLFFFRRFCFSPKRKSGKIPVVLLSILLLAACQPTPAEEAVVNKGEGRLEAAIHSAPQSGHAPESRAGEEAAQSLRDALGAPETVQRTVSGPVYGGTLHVEVDAAVHMPDVDQVPVLRVGRLHPSTEDKRRIAETLTGRTVFFEKKSCAKELKKSKGDNHV